MKLAELVDLEIQLLKDSDRDPHELRVRDRAIGRRFESKNLNREQLFLAWLKARVGAESETPGAIAARIYTWLRLIAILVGLAAGASTAAATLAYDGSTPVNVVHFLAVFVFGQILLLLLLGLSLLPSPINKLIAARGELLNLLRALLLLLARGLARLTSQMSPKAHRDWQVYFNRIRTRHSLYGKLERWLLLSITQRLGVAFNFGALGLCLYLIVFSDLAFAWNTTLQLQPGVFHRVVQTLALPWSKIAPAAVPSRELVEQTRYFRIEGQYQATQPLPDRRTANPEVVGGWWSFLVLSLLFYGLFPRLLLLLVTGVRLQVLYRRLPLDAADFESLYDRLTSPILETRSPTPEQRERSAPITAPPPEPLRLETKNGTVVLWGEIPVSPERALGMIQRRFGVICRQALPAGGLDPQVDERTLQALAAAASNEPVFVLAESWEVPSKAIMHFLRRVRAGSPQNRPLIVVLANNAANGSLTPPVRDDWENWRQSLLTLGDPYLRVESVVEAA